MYKKCVLYDTVRVPPTELGEDIEISVSRALREKLEGRIDRHLGMIVSILDIVEIGDGHILFGDGAVYYDTTFEALVFQPVLQEVIDGIVVEVVEFGAFVSIGPMDGLLHISQITSDFMSYDSKKARLVAKDTKLSISEGDKVRVRVVALSLNERDPRESKIGLTMRQVGLGKYEQLEEERKKEEVA
ncbi:DNA-directed RNA polymerase [Methanosarcinales archaeon]|nr:MAG: DNA-directed RNA polymerase [Methanosarcinales archaeon]